MKIVGANSLQLGEDDVAYMAERCRQLREISGEKTRRKKPSELEELHM